MNSASFEYRNMSARRGAQFVPSLQCRLSYGKPFPKTKNMLSTRNSSMFPEDYENAVD